MFRRSFFCRRDLGRRVSCLRGCLAMAHVETVGTLSDSDQELASAAAPKPVPKVKQAPKRKGTAAKSQPSAAPPPTEQLPAAPLVSSPPVPGPSVIIASATIFSQSQRPH